MDRNALILYLRDLRDLEFAKNRIHVLLEQEKQKCQRMINELSKSEFVQVPKEENSWSIGKKIVLVVLIALGICFLYFLLFGSMTEKEFFDDPRSFSGQGVRYYSIPVWQHSGMCMLSFIVIFSCLVGSVLIISAARNERKNNREYIENVKKHNFKEEIRVKENKKQIVEVQNYWNEYSKKMTKEYNTVTSLLQECYSQNILPSQYRNLASLFYIYDYMSTSQASLRDTLIHEHMENGIQRILDKLDCIIRQNQELIFQSRIAEANTKRIIEQNQKMLHSLAQIEADTSTSLTYAEISLNYSKANAYFGMANYLK